MKRKVLCVTLVLMICLLAAVPTFADIHSAKVDYSRSLGITPNNDGTYTYWGILKSNSVTNLSITLKLYNSSSINTPIAMSSNSANAKSVSASGTVSLSSGSYTLEMICSISSVSLSPVYYYYTV